MKKNKIPSNRAAISGLAVALVTTLATNIVNRRPASPYFGRIYVANARSAVTATGRPTGDGIYILNADGTDAVGQGDTALTGGLDMATGGTSMPWRLTIGENDDMLYICDWADSDGNLYRVDPD